MNIGNTKGRSIRICVAQKRITTWMTLADAYGDLIVMFAQEKMRGEIM